MLKKIILSLLILSTLSGCGSEKTSNEFAHDAIKLMNERKFGDLWEVTSPQSQMDVANQLDNVKNNSMLKQQVVKAFNIPANQIASITPKEYFVAILQADKTAGVIKTKIVDVKELDNRAKVKWTKGNQSGVSWLIKVDGSWYFTLDEV
ncbi:hypothetical protein HC723_14205 [Vibrio sp. S11_S32]|uniref:hypothetical protein n=1 Tax=Vibrio sp. S11_S32 TaxID=2720225 RepID=UPI0016815527|nr:hypothetical protein [Vibrio sp. S11_S32]MBD1577565.1 hypothetical protein [Vibrio sp. S11_S32]